ncbi:MAG: hypothetical protein AB4057_16130 [Crocosphaera sp.]
MTLTLQLDSEAVQVFENISDSDKEKLEMLVSYLFKNDQKSSIETLKKTMDNISDKEQARGLTPEILEEILAEE